MATSGLGLAALRSLNLDGSRIYSLDAPYLSARGSLVLGNGFKAKTAILRQAAIEGSLLLGGGALLAENTAALDCAGAAIGGDAVLTGAFRAGGAVLFDAAKIGGSLICAGGAFRNRNEEGTALALAAGMRTLPATCS